MRDSEVRIDSAGRVLIPVSVRRQLGVRAGSSLLLRMSEGGVELLTIDAAVKRAQALVRRRVPAGKSLVDDLLHERQLEARRE